MNKATIRRKESWEYLLELNPDVALLQEVNSIPDFIQNEFECLYRKAIKKNGQSQHFGTAILVKGKIIKPIQNSSPTFDYLWKGGPHGNQEVLDRMNALELVECLFHSKGVLTPTFKNATDKKVIHQIDHLFVSADLISNLGFCETGNAQHIFENSLSDHLPIIADFSV